MNRNQKQIRIKWNMFDMIHSNNMYQKIINLEIIFDYLNEHFEAIHIPLQMLNDEYHYNFFFDMKRKAEFYFRDISNVEFDSIHFYWTKRQIIDCKTAILGYLQKHKNTRDFIESYKHQGNHQ